MKKEITIIKSVAQAQELLGLSKPLHPLISIFQHADPNLRTNFSDETFFMDLYMIGLKDGELGSFQYGRNSYDYDSGTMIFMRPNQVFSPQNLKISKDSKGWTLLFHPDLIRKYELGKSINQYSFFSYESHEALQISEKEKDFINQLKKTIELEYSQNIDKYTQDLIVVNLESILKYCKRYYERQFYTRTNLNKDYIVKFEQFLDHYFSSDGLISKGIPSIDQCGEALNMSGHYLSDLLKNETGKSAKELIRLKLVEKAKNILLTTNSSISEIAFDLGFEYPNYFSKLFKAKTGMSPREYRNFN
ncbi:MAG: helix-turn-helix transcriptional regulator [Flavobacteriaceae bacterium]|nr:helix-turn-helix transcriptional regulator [Flavobacteriaceae bacterium]